MAFPREGKALYRVRAAVVEAVQWLPAEARDDVMMLLTDAKADFEIGADEQPWLLLRGALSVVLRPGDWIVREPSGSVTGYTHADFQKKYEAYASL